MYKLLCKNIHSHLIINDLFTVIGNNYKNNIEKKNNYYEKIFHYILTNKYNISFLILICYV